MRKDLLKQITEAATLQSELEKEVGKAEDAMKAAKKKLEKVSMELLPGLMREAELKMLKLDNGAIVEVRDEVSCGITKARADDALSWLRNHGFGGLIKTELEITFGKGDDDKALKLAQSLIKKGLDAHLDSSVHPGTLKSFIKEQREKGESPPEDLFGIYPYSVTKVTSPKSK